MILLAPQICAVGAVWLVAILVLSWLTSSGIIGRTPKNRLFGYSLAKARVVVFLIRWTIHIAAIFSALYFVNQYVRYSHSGLWARYQPYLRSVMGFLFRAAVAIVLAVAAYKFCGAFFGRITSRVRSSDTESGEAVRRARTLANVTQGFVSAVIVVLTILVIFPVAPLLTGAGLAGLAIAFSAQSLLKDFFSGFFIILEDQYGLGDEIKIGDKSGTVEKLTLRITVLRDEIGSVHTIPNGEIKAVTNMSRGWSAAIIDILLPMSVGSQEGILILERAADKLMETQEPGAAILQRPQVKGIQEFTVNGTVYRVTAQVEHSAKVTLPYAYKKIVADELFKAQASFAAGAI